MQIPESILLLDKDDPLQHIKSQFVLPQATIYLDGNSLGPLTKAAKNRLDSVVSDQWGNDLIASWNRHHWIDLPQTVGDKIAALIGAERGQVIACDSTSVNLFKVLSSALALNPNRRVVLTQEDNFPSDLYMAQGLSHLLGQHRCEIKSVTENSILNSLDQSVAVLMLTHVNFRSGRMHDMRCITKHAHEKGILLIWDLAHSAGALELDLDDCGVDFAVGCGYKYLNGGPGAPAFIYAAKKHHDLIRQPLTGWMGHSAPFRFEQEYRPGQSILRFLSGTPNILSMAALDAALDVFENLSLSDIRNKSIGLSNVFIESIASELPTQLQLESPSQSNQRGSQLAYSHPNAFEICQALADFKVVADYRAPNIIRFGFTPLYLSYQDVWTAAQRLVEVVKTRRYTNANYAIRSKVT